MLLQILFFALWSNIFQINTTPAEEMNGAWKITRSDGTHGLWIITDNYFSLTYYKNNPPNFVSTQGGELTVNGDKLFFNFEFNTQNKDMVGEQKAYSFKLKNNRLSIDGSVWKRVDDGTSGKLNGAWLITGRMRNGEMNTHTPGARKTMKILSGSRFQWIAYNSETAEFFGTGGGSYNTENGKYVENIKFFSRDNSRVGASLEFDYELKDGQWHHSGHSSKGDPLYEIWSRR